MSEQYRYESKMSFNPESIVKILTPSGMLQENMWRTSRKNDCVTLVLEEMTSTSRINYFIPGLMQMTGKSKLKDDVSRCLVLRAVQYRNNISQNISLDLKN